MTTAQRSSNIGLYGAISNQVDLNIFFTTSVICVLMILIACQAVRMVVNIKAGTFGSGN